MGIFKQTVEGFEKEVKGLKKKEEEYRKYAEYFNRQMREAGISEERFLKSKGKEEYWRMRQSEYNLKVKDVEGQIALMKINEQRKEYRTELIGFYRETIEYLISLKEVLEKKDMPAAGQIVDVLEQVYLTAGSLEKEDLKPISGYLTFQSIRIRIGRIVEEMGEEAKINATVGIAVGAQKRANVSEWVKQLIGQIDTLIKALEKRVNGPTK